MFGYIEKPVLEIKIKKGWLGKKLSFPLKGFALEKGCCIDPLSEAFMESSLPRSRAFDMNHFRPSLLNRYSRKYFISADRAFRITIDSEMEYFQMCATDNYFIKRSSDFNRVVLEMKYDQDRDDYADRITTKFPFRMTKNSKYVNGIERFYHI